MTMTEETMTMMIGQGYPVHGDEVYREIDRLRHGLAQAQRANEGLREMLRQQDRQTRSARADLATVMAHVERECRRSRTMLFAFMEREETLIQIEAAADCYTQDLVATMAAVATGDATGDVAQTCTHRSLAVLHTAVAELRTLHRIMRRSTTHLPGDEIDIDGIRDRHGRAH